MSVARSGREPPCGAPRSGLPPASAASARSGHRPRGALVTGRAALKPPAPGTLFEGGHDRCEHRSIPSLVDRCDSTVPHRGAGVRHRADASSVGLPTVPPLMAYRSGGGLRCPPRVAGPAGLVNLCARRGCQHRVSSCRRHAPAICGSAERSHRPIPAVGADLNFGRQFRVHVTQNYQIREQYSSARSPPPIGRDVRVAGKRLGHGL